MKVWRVFCWFGYHLPDPETIALTRWADQYRCSVCGEWIVRRK